MPRNFFCPRCRRAVPVRKRLLLVLPEADKYEYLCAFCSSTVGTKSLVASPCEADRLSSSAGDVPVPTNVTGGNWTRTGRNNTCLISCANTRETWMIKALLGAIRGGVHLLGGRQLDFPSGRALWPR